MGVYGLLDSLAISPLLLWSISQSFRNLEIGAIPFYMYWTLQELDRGALPSGGKR